MPLATFDLPMMYGDHHVTAVRKLLLEIPGVHQVYASSSFHIAEVEFDQEKVDAAKISDALAAAGYMGELPLAYEIGTEEREKDGKEPFFRHTAVLQQVGTNISFAQKVPFAGRPLWPCPGIGPIPQDE